MTPGRQLRPGCRECHAAFPRIGAAIASTFILLAPAIWNRFPLLQYDTGGYLVRWFEGYLVPSRSTVFGLFLNIFAHPDFWPVVVVQAALTVWVLALMLRALGFGGRPLVLLGVTAALSALTTLPWLTSILLTDIFAGLAVLAVHLLVFADGTLRRFERIALVALIAFAVATHSATFAVVVALLAAAALAWWYLRIGSASGIARGMAAVALGAAMLVGANYVVAGQLAWTPGGLALSFGRMLQDGIVNRYLADHCPEERLKLCAHRHELPTDADVFFWSGKGSVFNNLGRFAGPRRRDERHRDRQPARLSRLADRDGAGRHGASAHPDRQRRRRGEHHLAHLLGDREIRARPRPPACTPPASNAARSDLPRSTASTSRSRSPSMLLLLATVLLGWRREPFADLGILAGTATAALLANAFVCGVLSNPHDRYGARLVWIAPLVVTLLLCRLYARRGLSQSGRSRIAGPLAAEPVPPA